MFNDDSWCKSSRSLKNKLALGSKQHVHSWIEFLLWFAYTGVPTSIPSVDKETPALKCPVPPLAVVPTPTIAITPTAGRFPKAIVDRFSCLVRLKTWLVAVPCYSMVLLGHRDNSLPFSKQMSSPCAVNTKGVRKLFSRSYPRNSLLVQNQRPIGTLRWFLDTL